MRLSIIVPVYNMAGGGKLNYCMDSLIGQNLTDYEIIAVDDASTDDSFSVLQDYEKRYPDKVTAIRSPENRKQGGARNIGLDCAKGEWIGFIDSDDWIDPDMYRKLLEKAESTGADMVGCQYQLTHEHSMKPGKLMVNNTPDQTGVLDEERYRKLVLKPGSMVIKIYRKDVIDRYELRFPEKIFYEDNAVASIWMAHFKRFELVDEPLYYYYQHGASTVHSLSKQKCYNRMRAAEILVEESKKRGLYERYEKEIEARFTQAYYVNTLFSYMAAVKRPERAFLKELRDGMKTYFPDFRTNPYYMQMYDAEQRKMIDLHFKNIGLYILYDKMLWSYRRFRYGQTRA